MNPYAPPNQYSGQDPVPAAPAQKSTGVTVLGVFLIIFGALGLFSAPMTFLTRGMARDPASRRINELMYEGTLGAWTMTSLFLGTCLAGLMLASGIGIVKRRPWAKKTSLGYGISAIVMAIIGQIMSAMLLYPELNKMAEHGGTVEKAGAMGGMIGGMVGGCLGLVLPVITLIVMTRPNVKAQFV
jgi:hypothetical protein